MTPETKSMPMLLARYTRDFIRFSPWKMAQLILVSLLNGLTQGIGFFMLIPLLHMFGIGAEIRGDSPHRVAAWLGLFFQCLHLPATLATILTAFFILMAAAAALKYRQSTLTHKIQRTYTSHLQTRIFGAITRAQWRFVKGCRASGITHLITHDLPVVAAGSFFFLQILSGVAMSACYLFWAASISVRLTALVSAAAGLFFFLSKSCFPQTFQAGLFMRNARAGLFSILMDHVSGVKIAKSYGAETRAYQRFERISTRASEESIRIASQNARMTFGFQVMSGLTLCLVLYYSVAVLGIPLVEAGIAVIIFSRLVPMLSALQTHTQRLVSMLPAFEAAETFHRAAKTWAETPAGPAAGGPLLPLLKGIRLKHVSFTHRAADGQPGFSLRDLCLEIPAFKTTVVCGPSGAGKSILADLISGMLTSDTGTVEIDGIPLGKENLPAWRKTVGYVPQEVFLFNDTVGNNILWGNPGATKKEVDIALELALADRFVRNLPQGLNTRVRDAGTRLSGGERQRIALARTLVRNPKLLILDEATNALDRENEKAIFKALSGLRGKMTLLVISHSPTPLIHADQVIYMDSGKANVKANITTRKKDS